MNLLSVIASSLMFTLKSWPSIFGLSPPFPILIKLIESSCFLISLFFRSYEILNTTLPSRSGNKPFCFVLFCSGIVYQILHLTFCMRSKILWFNPVKRVFLCLLEILVVTYSVLELLYINLIPKSLHKLPLFSALSCFPADIWRCCAVFIANWNRIHKFLWVYIVVFE